MTDANLINKLNAALAAPARHALAAVIRQARSEGLALYLVGGSVRDLLLGLPTLDVDTTLEGDAPALARRVAARLADVRCTIHSAFGTATLKGADFRLDVATARGETYEHPGALPSVRPASLQDDLRRRDFSVNAIALALTGDERGAIVDAFGGVADLEAGLVRVLHENSFRDDATRILRGARYESRLGFRLEPDTLRWLARDVGYLETISGARIREELLRTLREPEPERILLRLQDIGALAAIHPALSFDGPRAEAFARLRALRSQPPTTAYLAVIVWGLSSHDAAALSDRLALNKREAQAARAIAGVGVLEPELSAEVKPSRAVELLAPLPSAAVWALAVSAVGSARRRAVRYLRRWRYVKPLLDGHDLLAMGARSGPQLGEALRQLKAAKLDREVRSRRDEERFVRALLAGQRSSSQTVNSESDDRLKPVPQGFPEGKRPS